MTRHRLWCLCLAAATCLASMPATGRADAAGLLGAVRDNDLQAVQALLAGGTPVDAVDGRGTTALHVAAGLGYPDLVRLLMAAGAPVDTRGALGNTPLHLAAQEGYTDIARLLVEAGADVSLRSRSGATALTWARGYGHRDIVALLASPEVPSVDADHGARWLLVATGAGLFGLLTVTWTHRWGRKPAHRLAGGVV